MAETNAPPSAMASEAEELSLVERLLTRLVLTEDSQLEQVLAKLLPFALSLLSSPHGKTKVKVTEMLSHINKRTKDHFAFKLPLKDLISTYGAPASLPIVKNFCIIYIEMAFDRSSLEERIEVIPDLLNNISSVQAMHQDVFLRLSAQGFAELPAERFSEDMSRKLRSALTSKNHVILVEFCKQTLLYRPNTTSSEGEVPGLSLAQVRRVCGKHAIGSEQLVARKLGLLNFVTNLDLKTEDLYPLFLVAAADSNDLVSRRGEELLKRKGSGVNLEDTALVKCLFNMFQGTVNVHGTTPETRVSPASVALKSRIVDTLMHSIAAANSFPLTLQCMFECLYGKTTTVKLKQSGMEFTLWVFKHASNDELMRLAPITLSSFLKILDDGTSTSIDSSVRPMRVFVYEAIGQLARRAPELFCGSMDMVKRLFNALRTESSRVRPTVQDTLNLLAPAYKGCSENIKRQIEAMLLENITAVEDEARFSALFWATELFSTDHAPSRFLCMLGAGDSKLDIREMSVHGLNSTKDEKSKIQYPTFKDMVTCICQQKPAILEPAQLGERALFFQPKVYVAMIEFVLKCFEKELDRLEDKQQDLELAEDHFRLLLEHGMAYDGTAELHASASKALLALASKDPKRFAKLYCDRLVWVRNFIAHVDLSTREAFARLLGIITCGLSNTEASDLLSELMLLIKQGAKARFEVLHGALCSAGYVTAQLMTRTPVVSDVLLRQAVATLVEMMDLSNLTMAGFACEALGHIGLRGPLPIPKGKLSAESDSAVLESSSSELKTQSAQKDSSMIADQEISMEMVISRLNMLLSSKDGKSVQKAAIAYGHLCFGDETPDLLDASITALFTLSKSKVEELLFSVGEAIAFIWGVVPATADTILQSNFVSLSSLVGFFGDDYSIQEAGSSKMKQVDARTNARNRIIRKLFDELLTSSRKEERCAGSVWLVSLITYSGRHYEIQNLLPDIQEALSHLLGDQDNLTQEMASRGMSIVYDLGNDSTKQELIKGLVGTLSGTAKRKRAVKLMEDTEVFEDGAFGQTPSGGKISTYKELCNLATEMGQPDLIYKFMDLANYQAAFNSKRGAAFGFARIAKHAGDTLMPHLRALVPKLFRYQYDPNKQIQEAMGHIWVSLVSEPKKTMDEYFDDIMEDLLLNMGSRLWRSRESSCLALADLLQGRRFGEVEKHLAKVWSMLFRALDDIKESVRKAAAALCRVVSLLTIRLCDSELTPSSETQTAMGIVLPFLLSNGIMSKVDDIRQVSITTIMKIVKGAGNAIRPQLPELICCMLESLSGLEDQRLNYAELHADSMGMNVEKLENIRIAVSRDSPMWDTLDICLRHLDIPTLELLIPRLVDLVRSSVGLNTRVGISKFIGSMSGTLGSSIRPYTGSLLKVLLPAVVSEKSIVVKRSFAAASTGVLKFSGERQAEQYLIQIIDLYKSGNKDACIAAGLLCREISRHCSDIVKAYSVLILPVSFIGRFDEDKTISGCFDEAWEDNTSTETFALQLYMAEIVPLVCTGLASSSWTEKKKCAKAAAALAEVAGDSAFVQPLISSLLKEVPGRIWEGKECVLQAIGSLCKSCSKAILNGKESCVGPTEILEVIFSACTRQNRQFSDAAYSCLEQILDAFHTEEICAPAITFLVDICGKSISRKENEFASPAGSDSTDGGSVPLDKVLACLAACLPSGFSTTVTPHAQSILRLIVSTLSIGAWQEKLGAISTLRKFIKCIGPNLLQPDHVVIGKDDSDLILQMGQVIERLLDAASNVKIAQVRTTALECLQELIQMANFTTAIANAMESRLSELESTEKSSVIKAHIMSLRELIRSLRTVIED